MERKLLTKGGSTLYKLRSQMVEPVFGQIKAVRDCHLCGVALRQHKVNGN